MTRNTYHGATKTNTYVAWQSMRFRCKNPKSQAFRDYGGRGITVCERWDEFPNFLADMGHCPPGRSLDRIDNDLGYFPENCRWATKLEQTRNRRNTVRITAFGVTRPGAEWAEYAGVAYHTVVNRIGRGWSPEEAVSTPPLRSKYARMNAASVGAQSKGQTK